MGELVSVIVPVYKVEDLLERCVDSILGQSHQELQVILVDDGSPDRCGAICDEYAARDHRVEVIHQMNAGLSAARNAGLDCARGAFVTFVDSDDWIHPEMVLNLVRLAHDHAADVVVCEHVKTETEDVEPDTETGSAQEMTNVDTMRALLSPSAPTWIITCAKLYRADLFEGIRFPPGRYHEDAFTTHQLLWRANKTVYTDAGYYYYWQREGSIMASSCDPSKRVDDREACRARGSFLRSVGLRPEARLAYRRAFWMGLSDIRRLQNSEDKQAIRQISREMRGLARDMRSNGEKVWVLARVYLCAVAPRLAAVQRWTSPPKPARRARTRRTTTPNTQPKWPGNHRLSQSDED